MLGLVLSQYLSHGSRYSGLGIDDDGGMGMVTDGSVTTDTDGSVTADGGTDAAGDRAGADAEERRRDGRKG